jgi:hypothetical protein
MLRRQQQQQEEVGARGTRPAGSTAGITTITTTGQLARATALQMPVLLPLHLQRRPTRLQQRLWATLLARPLPVQAAAGASGMFQTST